MAQCGTCGANGIGPGSACPQCGAMLPRGLELDVPAPPPLKAVKPRAKAVEPASFDLAVDPRELVAPHATEMAGAGWPPVTAAASDGNMRAFHARPPASPGVFHASSKQGPLTPADDVDADAFVLADVGSSPSSWVKAPMYAWRVLKRQRELRQALVARRAEAERAAEAVEDALVAFLERVRATAEKLAPLAAPLEDLQRAEDVLRSRDRVLAAEQDAQRARQQQVDARIGQLEADRLAAREAERAVASELTAAQAAFAREEAKLKRAEAELKTAQSAEKSSASGAGG